MTGGSEFAIAHAMPGRIRLRWRGEGHPATEMLSRLGTVPCVNAVEYRPSSRSLVLLHGAGFDLHDLRAETGDLDAAVDEIPRAAPWSTGSSADSGGHGARRSVVTDLEALLTLGLMVVWVRELIVGRTIRPATIILLILTGLSLYQFWQRRQRRGYVEEVSPEQEPGAS